MSQQKQSNDHADNKNELPAADPLMNELDQYREKGIALSIRGRCARPADIAFVCRVCEGDTPYMRDYITDENGIVQMIDFVKVR